MNNLVLTLIGAPGAISCKPNALPSDPRVTDAAPAATRSAAASATPSATPPSTGSFEGEIELESYPYAVVTELKGERSRTEFRDRGSAIDGHVLVDRKANTLVTLVRHGTEHTITDLATVKPKVALTATSTGHTSSVQTIFPGGVEIPYGAKKMTVPDAGAR